MIPKIRVGKRAVDFDKLELGKRVVRTLDLQNVGVVCLSNCSSTKEEYGTDKIGLRSHVVFDSWLQRKEGQFVGGFRQCLLLPPAQLSGHRRSRLAHCRTHDGQHLSVNLRIN